MLVGFCALLVLAACAELQELGLDAPAINMPDLSGALDVFDPPSRDAVALLSAVPRQPIQAFRARPHLGVEVQTQGYSRRPFFLSPPAQVQFTIDQCQTAYLAGSPRGETAISLNNFLLLELKQDERRQLIAVGDVEPLRYRGQPVTLLGPKRRTIAAGSVRLERILATGVPTQLTITALANGDNGAVSDVFLIIEDVGRLETDEAGINRCRPFERPAPPTSQPSGSQPTAGASSGATSGASSGPSSSPMTRPEFQPQTTAS
ncbi:MAG: hypothetical protein AAF213_05850 [Pseudomonadota bacterium]